MLYVNGDSWSQPTPYVGVQDIWPNLLAKRLDQELVNQGMGCGSNKRILDCLENFYLEGMQPTQIIIALTTDCRECLPAAEMKHWNINAGFARSENTGENDPFLGKWWTTNSFDPVESIYQYYKTLWNIHNLCTKFNCPYFMFQAWDTNLAKYDLLGGSEKVAKFLEKYYPNENAWFRVQYANAFQVLTEHSKNWNYVEQPLTMTPSMVDIWPNGHPTKEGHEKLAEFVYQHI